MKPVRSYTPRVRRVCIKKRPKHARTRRQTPPAHRIRARNTPSPRTTSGAAVHSEEPPANIVYHGVEKVSFTWQRLREAVESGVIKAPRAVVFATESGVSTAKCSQKRPPGHPNAPVREQIRAKWPSTCPILRLNTRKGTIQTIYDPEIANFLATYPPKRLPKPRICPSDPPKRVQNPWIYPTYPPNRRPKPRIHPT